MRGKLTPSLAAALVAPRADAGTLLGYLARIRENFSGPAVIARDLESF